VSDSFGRFAQDGTAVDLDLLETSLDLLEN
jgi:hypothetical protein